MQCWYRRFYTAAKRGCHRRRMKERLMLWRCDLFVGYAELPDRIGNEEIRGLAGDSEDVTATMKKNMFSWFWYVKHLSTSTTNELIIVGSITHSHDYREPDSYKDRRVLIIGAGPSGMDIALDVANVSKTLVHSHHSQLYFKRPFIDGYKKKPDVKEYTENGVIFQDGSYEDIDDVIYCTGYEYYYPFLDKSCNLTINSRSVTPLHKYMVNIHHPSMVLMGLIVKACLVVSADVQSRYATALIKGNFTLPSKEQMLEDWQKRVQMIKSKGRPLSDIHLLGDKEDDYYAELTKESGIDRVPPVMFKIRKCDTQAKMENLYTYRNYNYKVIDNNTFSRTIGEISGFTGKQINV